MIILLLILLLGDFDTFQANKDSGAAAFSVRRFDIAARELPPEDPLYIESLIRSGQKEKALEVAESIKPIDKRLKAAIPLAYFNIKNSLLNDVDPKKLPLEQLNDYVLVLVYSFEYEKARALIKTKEYYFNSNPEALLTQAILLLRESKPNDAMNLAERGVILNPHNPDLLHFIEDYEGRRSVLEQSLNLLNKLESPTLSQSMSHLRTLVSLITLEPENKEALLAQASKVISSLDDKLQDVPEFLVLKGIVLSQQGKSEEAKDSIEKALALDKTYGLAIQTLAGIYRLNNQLQNAAILLEEGAFYNAQDSSYFRQLASTYMGLKNYPEALKAVNHALEITPASAPLLEMKSAISKALQINPQDA